MLLARRGFSSQSTALSQQAYDKSAVSKQDIAEWRWYLPRAPLAERRQGPCGPLPLIPSPRMERRRDKAKCTCTERSPPPPGPCGTAGPARGQEFASLAGSVRASRGAPWM